MRSRPREKDANVHAKEARQRHADRHGPCECSTSAWRRWAPAIAVRSGDSAANLVTEAGAILGTPAYMSPEQVSGFPVDHRTDIFSFGVLLYEIATGVRPFHGRSSAEVTSSILRDAPRPASEVRPAVPGSLSSVIHRCLEKNLAARFASMAEVSRALRPDTQPASAAKGPSVAVLPFQNLSADKDNEFFATAWPRKSSTCSQIDGPASRRGRRRSRSRPRRRPRGDCRQAARCPTVLDGSVRRSGNRLRVTVQLAGRGEGVSAVVGALRPRDGGHLRRAGRDRAGDRRQVESDAGGRRRGPAREAGHATSRHEL